MIMGINGKIGLFNGLYWGYPKNRWALANSGGFIE